MESKINLNQFNVHLPPEEIVKQIIAARMAEIGSVGGLKTKERHGTNFFKKIGKDAGKKSGIARRAKRDARLQGLEEIKT